MPLTLRLPLFARSKTTNIPARSHQQSPEITAADSAINSSTSIPDLRKASSVLHKRRGRSKSSAASRTPAPSASTTHSTRTASDSPPAASPDFGVDSTLLGSVGEEKEETEPLGIVRHNAIDGTDKPALVLQEATPPGFDDKLSTLNKSLPRSPLGAKAIPARSIDNLSIAESVAGSSNASPRHISSRRPSLADSAHATLTTYKPSMPRKIWVKRPNASATLVQVKEDDLVDDVRDMILRKYANSLGRTFDAPDMTLRIVPRSEAAAARQERVLGPEEEMCRVIDAAYPGGQTVDEALLISVPTRSTPKPSPKHYPHHLAAAAAYPHDDYGAMEMPKDYFSLPVSQPGLPAHGYPSVPQLPVSPGLRHKTQRPRAIRGHTSSPTIVQTGVPPQAFTRQGRAHADSSASDHGRPANTIPHPPALPATPAADPSSGVKGSTPPTPAVSTNSQRHPLKSRKTTRPPATKKPNGKKGHRRNSTDTASNGLPGVSNMLEGIVPPINVLIVEDNSINLRILEGLMKRLKVRWSTAVNGQIAVDKWRQGGFHLILMDIQMPVMNGLEATKEIRRLEKVNGIGVFSSSAPSSPEEKRARRKEYMDGTETESEATETEVEAPVKRDPAADRLTITQGNFKSPIIIVALTASSLQSDRHEALAAGCNDFLTKPVQGSWLERKVKEWGCMQALIDFDGWKRWRDINEKDEANKNADKDDKAKKKAALASKTDAESSGSTEIPAIPVLVNGH